MPISIIDRPFHRLGMASLVSHHFMRAFPAVAYLPIPQYAGLQVGQTARLLDGWLLTPQLPYPGHGYNLAYIVAHSTYGDPNAAGVYGHWTRFPSGVHVQVLDFPEQGWVHIRINEAGQLPLTGYAQTFVLAP